ncbi:MAG: FG-GAP-like repeat-containing protein [Bacteroidota bacterium]|nr:FG-GAP-like repeat-containing protein [Bacteroidota bacterium]
MKLMVHLAAFFTILMAVSADAQVKFEYYNVEDSYYLLNIPTNSIMLVRFDATAPVRITEVSAWFVTGSTGGSVDLIMFGKEGGYHFPYQLNPLFQPIRIDIPGGKDSLYRFRFQTPIDIGGPTQFFVGLVKRSDSINVRMDRITQYVPCANDEGDSSYTNMFAVYDPGTQTYSFGAWFSNRQPINNWYIGAAGEYYNDQPSTFFTDVTIESGISAAQSVNPRLAWADYDNDGDEDLLSGNRLYRNNGDGTFDDVAAQVGYTRGSAVQMFVDIDNDGDLDIVCQPDNLIYLNNSNGTFALSSPGGLGTSVNTQAMAFADYNGDKLPDFFVANGEYMYAKNPANPSDSALIEGAAWTAHLYTNLGGGQFTDHTANLAGYQKGQYGRNPYNTSITVEGYRPAACAQWTDFDNDGDLDLFVGVDRLQPNYLFENQGTPNFRSVAQAHGAQGGTKPGWPGLYGNTRGCDFGDYNNDGTFDLLTGETALPYRLGYSDMTSVWKNDPTLSYSFVNMQATAKLGYTTYQADVAWADFNQDGLLDFYVTSGERCYGSTLFMQNPDGSFTDVTYESGTGVEDGFGVVWVDYDNDGDLDLSVASPGGLRLFRNDYAQKGNWAQFRLRSVRGNAYAIGARIRVYAGGKMYSRLVTAGKGAGTQQPYVLHFGVGSAAILDSVIVRWPNKRSQTLYSLPVNQVHSIVETDPAAVPGEHAAGKPDLMQNFPNPFSKSNNRTTSIAYNLPSAAHVKLELYDLRGARIATLVDARQNPGLHFVEWAGTDDSGRHVASGTYRYVLSADGTVLTRRLVVLR